MSSTLSSTSAIAPLSVYYGKDIPTQMSEVRNGILRDISERVEELMNTINHPSPEEVQRFRDEEDTILQNSRTETGEYVCRYEDCAHSRITKENDFLYGYKYNDL